MAAPCCPLLPGSPTDANPPSVITLSRIFKYRLWGLRSPPLSQMRESSLNPFLLVQQHQGITQHFLGSVVLTLCISRPVQNTTPKCLCLRGLQHHNSGYRSHLIIKTPFTAPFLALLWCYLGSPTMVQALKASQPHCPGCSGNSPSTKDGAFGVVYRCSAPSG